MNTLVGETGNAGAVAFGGPHAAPAQFQVGAVGFGPAWSDGLYEEMREARVCTACGMADSMAASIVRLERDNEELRAANAVAEQERAILVREMEKLREQIAGYRARL